MFCCFADLAERVKDLRAKNLGLIILSISLTIVAGVALGCCACKICQGSNQIHPIRNLHTHNLRQITHEARKATPFVPRTIADKLVASGVRYPQAKPIFQDEQALMHYGVRPGMIALTSSVSTVCPELIL